MANGTIVAAWEDGRGAHLAVSVSEANGDVVEYIGAVPLAQLQGLTGPQQKAALVAAVKAVRDAQQGSGPAGLGLSGAVTL